MKYLVIVESPAKARTINRYLGDEYRVIASVGHIRDLPKSKLGVDLDNNFEPAYLVPKEKKKVVSELKSYASKSERIFIATDPDREGEAIGWHISELLNLPSDKIFRVLFQEITKRSVNSALESPIHINTMLVESQQTRRILDRIMGYSLSPLLWKKVKKGLSAGRVQSVALKMVCDRESEREAFKSEEYWTFGADLEGNTPPPFRAALEKYKGKKAKISNETEARELEALLHSGSFTVSDIKTSEKKKTPPPPFTTAKLQQEAHRRFRYTVKKTMKLAQSLYEGKSLGEHGQQGLITYMRTDSLRVAPEALDQVREHISTVFGKEFLPAKPRFYKNKNKIQDAHEAIRPASVALTPSEIKPYLDSDEWKLYNLIYSRFVASQMAPALLDRTDISILNSEALFKARGDVITFLGFLSIYGEKEEKKDEQKLPLVSSGESLTLHKLEVKQNFTQPPPRFTEATLVKALEEKGIGRPSTYASIISTIQNKDYCSKEEQAFAPTPLGKVVNDILISSFPEIIDESYTANLEKQLDQVELGETDRTTVLKLFYDKFKSDLDKATESLQKVKGVPTGEFCPECEKELFLKWGKNGQFIACSGYPECKFTKNVLAEDAEPCEKCGSPMVVKKGKFGTFYACSAYPECKNTRKFKSAFKSEDTGVSCPRPDCEGTIVSRKSKKGRIFYGCSTYPKCDYALWSRPILEPCAICGHPFTVLKGKHKVCPEEETHS